MNFNIINFYNKKTQITRKYFCKKNGGHNISPHIKWNKIQGAKSYSLVMEDPLSIHGNTVHWFIPAIYDDKIIYGLNTYKTYGWFGPCPPENTGKHQYIFTLYSLDNIFDFNLKKQINSSHHYEELLNSNNIKILHKEIKVFDYDSNTKKIKE